MAAKRAGGLKTGIRMLMWLLAVIAAAFMLIILLQQLKMIDLKIYIPGMNVQTIPPPDWANMELLDKDRIDQMMIANDNRREELDVQERNIRDEEIKLEEQRKQLEKDMAAVEEKEKRLREEQKLFEKKRETITQTARELSVMDYEVAVSILEKRDNQDIIWIMRVTDELAAEAGGFSVVPEWLALMDAARAAEIHRERDLIPDPEI